VKYLRDKRGIGLEAVTGCGIGYDPEHPKWGRVWVFPCFTIGKFTTQQFISGFEFRKVDFTEFMDGEKKRGKCVKQYGTPSELSYVNMNHVFNTNRNKLVVSEGFIDGYTIYQYYIEKKGVDETRDNYTIITPTCGVKGIYEYWNNYPELKEYKEVIFYLDKDEAGDSCREKMLSINKDFKFVTFQDGYDFNKWYMERK